VRIGVPKETAQGERRVALVPDVVKRLTGLAGHTVVIEPGAGEAAAIPDAHFTDAGAEIGGDVWNADVVVKVAPPSAEEIVKLKGDTFLIAHLAPLTKPDGTKALADAKVADF
jgi:NAD(P) transhydrogenase subunit alpha